MSTPFVTPAPPALLLVEGATLKVLFEAWLPRLGKTAVQVINFGGISELNGTLQRVADPVFLSQGRSLAVVRDAEQDMNAAFQSVCHGLQRCKLPVPESAGRWTSSKPMVGVFILPDNRSVGMIESLCLTALEQSETGRAALACTDAFLSCLATAGKSAGNQTKARLHATLAGWGHHDPRVGAAARAGSFDWNSPAFAPLAEFLDSF
jgi:hypothetical protein